MNIPRQFEQIGFFLADYGLITILVKMATSMMLFFETDSLIGKEAPHGPALWYCAGSQQEVKMVGDQRPGKAGRITATYNGPQAIQKPLAVRIVKKNLAAGDPAHNDMMQCTGSIDS